MDVRFEEIFSHPSNEIFNSVFFPDRIYHAQYLSATRSPRYRYDVDEVRGKSDIVVLKGSVYFDSQRLCSFMRIEYRASRLVEQIRERGRRLGDGVLADVTLFINGVHIDDDPNAPKAQLRLAYDAKIDAFAAEVWETLEPPAGRRHDYKVLTMMGHEAPITRVPAFDAALADIKKLGRVELVFSEDHFQYPSGYGITDPESDNFFRRNYQIPPSRRRPTDEDSNRHVHNYHITFQRGFYIEDISQMEPIRYFNPLMSDKHPDHDPNNFVDMRWVFQRELGGSLVFFHEVTVEGGKVEGTHQHIGSEELYYIVEGEGLAYLGKNDDPTTSHFPIVDQHIFGLDVKGCREVPIKAGSVIFTKSGGIHGIQNPNTDPLRFVAFLYHAQ